MACFSSVALTVTLFLLLYQEIIVRCNYRSYKLLPHMLFNIHSLKIRQVFLIDGIGALLSALFLWLIYYFRNVFGVPDNMFKLLIVYPVLFACYSLICAWLTPVKWKSFLSIIMTCNLLYIIFSLGLVSFYFEELYIPAVIYFLAETLIVLTVVYFEYCMLKKK